MSAAVGFAGARWVAIRWLLGVRAQRCDAGDAGCQDGDAPARPQRLEMEVVSSHGNLFLAS